MELAGSRRQMDFFPVTQVVSDAQFGRMIGNSMSVNVLERLLAALLPVAGLAHPEDCVDRWAPDAPMAP